MVLPNGNRVSESPDIRRKRPRARTGRGAFWSGSSDRQPKPV